MKIAGFKKQSLVDFPGNISSVVFTQGCNFRCGYCHNPTLVLPEKFGNTFQEDHILTYLSDYKNMLDAVCITGGEPTIHRDLPAFIIKIKQLGLKVKLDSNGTHPDMLQYLCENRFIDFIAMDIKHVLDFRLYYQTVGNWLNKNVFLNILKSIVVIKKSKIDVEFRTTVAKGLHSKEHIKSLKKQFGTRYKIQNYKPEIVLNSNIAFEPFSESEYKELLCF